ncbi:MAG: hypothetical protein WCD38_07460 [Candidatus Tumulicola sp.]
MSGTIDGYQKPCLFTVARLIHVDLTVTPSLQPRTFLILHPDKAEVSLFIGVHGGRRSDTSNGRYRRGDAR